MNDKQILKEAIRKAVDNGWDAFGMASAVGFTPEAVLVNYMANQIIFDIDFAKALFGTDRVGLLEDWQEELQDMVLSEDRMEYLRCFLEQDALDNEIEEEVRQMKKELARRNLDGLAMIYCSYCGANLERWVACPDCELRFKK